jgi:hypothetical protein
MGAMANGSTDEERPVACALDAVSLRSQSGRWDRVLAASGQDRLNTVNGIRLRFRADPGVAQEVRELVAVENDCCGWADWTVTDPGDVVDVVVVSTGEGVAALHGMFIRGGHLVLVTDDA